MKRKEEHVQAAICEFLEKKYPKIWYKSDLSGENMPGYNARRKQMLCKQRGFSDLSIFPLNGLFGMLALEVKTELEFIAKQERKTGLIKWANDHVQEQAQWIDHLNNCGHHATFALGYDHGIRIIDAVMNCDLVTLDLISIITPEQAFKYHQLNNNTVWHQIQKAGRQRARSSR